MATGDESRILAEWSQQLARALEIPDLDVQQELLLDLARKSAASVIHAAAPVTAFMVGYAAGQEVGRAANEGSSMSSSAATLKAADVAFALCENEDRRKDGHRT